MPLVRDLDIQPSEATFNALPLVDFTGGLSLAREGFSLADNQSPDMLNVDVMREGGVCRRKTLAKFSLTIPSQPVYIGQTAFYDEVEKVLVSAENTRVYEVDVATGERVLTAIPTSAGDPWRFVQVNNKMYCYNGFSKPRRLDPDGTVTSMNSAWNDEVDGSNPIMVGYEQPTGGSMPTGYVASYFQGKLWMANITYPAFTQPLSDKQEGQAIVTVAEAATPPGVKSEPGLNADIVYRPNRIHFSFPAQGETGPEDWNSEDWFDLDEGQDGERITALVPCGGIMYAFKEHSVYAIQLLADGTPSYARVYDNIGTPSMESVTCWEDTVYFWDSRTGLNGITRNAEGRTDVGNLFRNLENLFDNTSMSPTDWDDVSVGYWDGRVLVSIPGLNETYVCDTRMETNPWMRYDWDISTMFYFSPRADEDMLLAVSNRGRHVLRLFYDKAETDYYSDVDYRVIHSHYKTNWFGAATSSISNPFSKKQWSNLDVIGYGEALEVKFYGDQDERNYLGKSMLNFPPEPPVNDNPIILDDYVFPVQNLVDPGLGRALVADPYQEYPADTPTFGYLPGEAKHRSDCVGLPPRSYSLQLEFTGETEDWCIASILIQFREYPPFKTAYEVKQ